MDAMVEAAEVQPAKRVCTDTRVGSACKAACDIVIIDQQHFQHRKSDLQTLRRQVICNSTWRSTRLSAMQLIPSCIR